MKTILALISLVLMSAAFSLAAQRGAAPPGQRPAPTNFPAQQRPAGDATVLARGRALYEMHCRLCHGVDLRGGDQGGPNLLRSQAALNDKAGELISAVVRDGRRNPGMPP